MNDLISRLSEIRSNYNCMDGKEEPYYRALSVAIQLASVQPDADAIHLQKEQAYKQGWEDGRASIVQPTLYGYDIEHLKLIANVLQKENLPPEGVTDALMNIGRIVSIVRDEFEETLRKSVEQCMI